MLIVTLRIASAMAPLIAMLIVVTPALIGGQSTTVDDETDILCADQLHTELQQLKQSVDQTRRDVAEIRRHISATVNTRG